MPESGRQDADDEMGNAVKADRLPDQCRAGAEAPPPQRIAKDDDVSPAQLPFFRQKRAPQPCRHAEDRKEVCRDPRGLEPLGISAACQIELGAIDQRHVLERSAAALPFHKVPGVDCEHGGKMAELGNDLRYAEKAIGIPVRERAQEHAVDDREDRGVGADAEPEDKNGRDGEPPVTPKHPKSEVQILEECGHDHYLRRCAESSSSGISFLAPLWPRVSPVRRFPNTSFLPDDQFLHLRRSSKS